MFLFILGIILVGVGFTLIRSGGKSVTTGRIVAFLGLAMGVYGFFSSFIVVMQPGEVGVKVLFGKVEDDVLKPGVNIVNPFASIDKYNVQTQNYTMSADHQESDRENEDAINVLTADGLEVVIDVTVQYHVDENMTPKIRRELGTEDAYKTKIVRPFARNKIRDNAVYFDAVSLYSSKRDTFQLRIQKSIEKEFALRGLVMENLLIRHISLPASVKAAIESKINAEQEAQKMAFVLQKEKQEAERKRVEARGIADYQLILSQGLSDRQLQYEMIKAQQALANSPNAKIIIMGGGKSAPFLLNAN